jgi:hypothetical protein
MAQDRPAEHRKRYSPDNATQPHEFIPHMLPFGAGMAGAFGLPSFLPPNANGLAVQYPMLNNAPFSAGSFPFLDQFSGFSSDHPTASRPSGFGTDHSGAYSAAGLKPPREYVSHNSAFAPLPMVSPGGQKRSRLPSDDVGRKAPRKSISSSPQQMLATRSSINTPASKGKKPQRSSNRRVDSSVEPTRQPPPKNGTRKFARTPGSEAKKSPAEGRRDSFTVSARGRRVVRDEEDDDDPDYESPVNGPNAVSIERFSPGFDVDTRSTRRNTASRSVARASSTRNDAQPTILLSRPRPQYDYPVPKELDSVQKALGEDNWNEMLILMERNYLGTITAEELRAATKPIFLTFDETTRRSIERRITNRVVVPVLRERVQSGKEQ